MRIWDPVLSPVIWRVPPTSAARSRIDDIPCGACLAARDRSGALVFQIIGQQISVIAATAIFGRLTGHFHGRVPDAGELAAVTPQTLRDLGLSRRWAEIGRAHV